MPEEKKEQEREKWERPELMSKEELDALKEKGKEFTRQWWDKVDRMGPGGHRP